MIQSAHPFKHPIKRQKNWLHWLALQTFFAGRTHVQVPLISLEALSLKVKLPRLRHFGMGFVTGSLCLIGLGLGGEPLSGSQVLVRSLLGGMLGGTVSWVFGFIPPKQCYRLLVGLIAGTVLGAFFGLIYGHMVQHFFAVAIALPFGSRDWSEYWEASLPAQMMDLLGRGIFSGMILGWLTLIPAAVLGYLDQIIWGSRIRVSGRSLGQVLLWSAIPAVLLGWLTTPSGGLGFFLALSSNLGFAIALRSRKLESSRVRYRSPWVKIAFLNSCYLLLLAVPSALVLLLHGANSLFSSIQLYALGNHFSAQYPWLKTLRDPMHQVLMATTGGYFGLSLGLVWVLRGRPVSALLSLIQYGVLRLTIWLYGLGPLNYGAFLRRMVAQGVLVAEPQGYRFGDAEALKEYALTPHDCIPPTNLT